MFASLYNFKPTAINPNYICKSLASLHDGNEILKATPDVFRSQEKNGTNDKTVQGTDKWQAKDGCY